MLGYPNYTMPCIRSCRHYAHLCSRELHHMLLEVCGASISSSLFIAAILLEGTICFTWYIFSYGKMISKMERCCNTKLSYDTRATRKAMFYITYETSTKQCEKLFTEEKRKDNCQNREETKLFLNKFPIYKIFCMISHRSSTQMPWPNGRYTVFTYWSAHMLRLTISQELNNCTIFILLRLKKQWLTKGKPNILQSWGAQVYSFELSKYLLCADETDFTISSFLFDHCFV